MYRDLPSNGTKNSNSKKRTENNASVVFNKNSDTHKQAVDEFETRIGVTPTNRLEDQTQPDLVAPEDPPEVKPDDGENTGEDTSKFWSQTESNTDFSKSVAFRGSSRRRAKPMSEPEPDLDEEEGQEDIDQGIDKKAYLTKQG